MTEKNIINKLTEKNLISKLIEIQKELKAPKAQRNTFGKYNYRSAEDILEAVKPLNAEKGLLLLLSDEPILIGEWHYIKATATITDGKETREVTAYARESETKKGMDHSQITGTASSYARKYALNGLYLIDDTKDADSNEYRQATSNKQQGQQQQQQQKQQQTQYTGITQQQLISIRDNVSSIATKDGVEQVEVYRRAQERAGIEKPVRQLSSKEANSILKVLLEG